MTFTEAPVAEPTPDLEVIEGAESEPVQTDGEPGPSAQPDQPNAPEAMCAFMVVISPEGKAYAIQDFGGPLNVHRMANIDDIYRATTEIAADVNLIRQASVVIQHIDAFEQAKREQETNSRILQGLHSIK